jgi:hypothetical protein
VTSDVTLKRICFTSRELIVVLFNFCDVVVSAPVIQSQAKKSYYDEKRLREIQIQHRLELFHGVLQVLSLLYFLLSSHLAVSNSIYLCFLISLCLSLCLSVAVVATFTRSSLPSSLRVNASTEDLMRFADH